MTALSFWGALATLIAVAFGCSTADRWARTGARHERAWTISLAMFAVGSFALFWAGATGWAPLNFRLFYLFGAILNVPWLALGTFWLLAPASTARRAEAIVTWLTPFCAGVVLATPLRATVEVKGLPSGKEVFGLGPRLMAGVGSGLAASVILAGAAWSAWRWLRISRTNDPAGPPKSVAGRLAITNICIADGTLVLGSSGAFLGSGDAAINFSIALCAGIGLLFAGFLISSRRPAPTERSPFVDELIELARPSARP